MDFLAGVDWPSVFLPQTPLLEIFVRGTTVYLTLVAMLRFVLKREAGSLAITDLLVIVLLADAAQNAMADDYHSITDGLLLIATIVAWAYFLNWLAFRYAFIRKIVKPPKLQLVKNGRILRRHLKEELITEDELMSEIRSHGVASLDQVREAYIEQDGMISVITTGQQDNRPPQQKAF